MPGVIPHGPGRGARRVERLPVADVGDDVAIRRAADILNAGGVVAIPTDTVYGLAAALHREDALERIYEIKGRPADRPLPVLLADLAQLDRVAITPSRPTLDLLSRFWPGALTVALPAHPGLPSHVLASDCTVGVRVPAHGLTRGLLREIGGTLAVTSANKTGQSPGRDAADVLVALANEIDLVVDDGTTPGDGASTVVGIRNGVLVLHREGVIAWRAVQQAWQDAGGELVASPSGTVR